MPAFDSAQASASTGTVSDRVLLDALVVVAARRIVLGVDVAAAKFLSGQRVDDLVREQEILESMASTLKRAELQHPLRIEFFRDQIEANKVIQRSLYRYWSVHPEQFPVRRRHLTAELRPQLDLIDRHMLLILIRMKNMPPVRRSHIDALFDRRLRTGTALRQLGELRRDAAGAHDEARQVGGEERLIQRRRGRVVRRGERDVNLQMAAGHRALNRFTQRCLEGIELSGQVEMQIQRAVIDALHAQHDLPLGNRFSYPGEARHALDAH